MENQIKFNELQSNIFKNKNFMLLFIGKLFSQLGDVIYNMAIGWYILTITNSAVEMSMYMALGTIIYVFAGPLGGVIADRMDRKKLIVWMDFIRGIVVSLIGLLMYFNVQSIWLFYVASVVLSICGAVFVPASNAIIPNIVKDSDLTKANSMGASVQGVSSIVGLIAGGILYAILGIKNIFILNAISYIICGILELFISIQVIEKPLADKPVKKHFIKELIETYVFIKSKKGFYILMWFGTLINFILVPLFAIFVPYIFNQILKVSTIQYSYVGVASALGFILGAALVSFLPPRDKINLYFRGGMAGFCILLFSLYLGIRCYYGNIISGNVLIILIVIIFLLLGISNSIMNIPVSVVMQRIIPNEMLGRTSALVNTLIMCSMPLGIIIGGIVTDLLPMQTLVLINAAIIFLATIFLYLQKDIRNI